MIPVATTAEARSQEAAWIGEFGVPGIALMEVACAGIVDIIRRYYRNEAALGVLVVCGAGNNGGDGFGVARWLKSAGIPVTLWCLAETAKGDAATTRASAMALGLATVENTVPCGLIVDAVFGTGLDRPVTGIGAHAIAAMNAHGAPVLAVDLPSGLHGDTGVPMGSCVRAQRTVVLGRYKAGLFCGEGPSHAGELSFVDLGFPATNCAAALSERSDVHWPIRDPGDHKNRSGHLLLVAGSQRQAGAAILAARGALAGGVGLLTLLVPEGAVPRLGSLPPEVMLVVHGRGGALADIPDGVLDGRTAVAAGPGLGNGGALAEGLEASLRDLWATSQLPVVFDADALGCTGSPARAPRVLTPHPGETARLLNSSNIAVQANRLEAVQQLVQRGTALLKGRYTLIAESGAPIVINGTNSPVLATGGSGDVLLGLIGALLARGLPARDAAVFAAWVHGRAGERLAQRRSQGWSASDIASELPDAIAETLG